MTASWLLVLIIHQKAVTMHDMPTKESCIQAGELFAQKTQNSSYVCSQRLPVKIKEF